VPLAERYSYRKGLVMLDAIYKTFLVGVGLAAVTKEKIDAHVNELVEKGRLSEKEGRDLAEDMLKKSEQARKDLQKRIETSVEQALHRLNLPSRQDLEKLATRIDKLETAKKK